MKQTDLYWLAGLLEGEGCFSVRRGPSRADGTRIFSAGIQVNMNDKDVLERAAALMECRVGGPYGLKRGGNPNAQAFYSIGLTGDRAVRIMKMILPIMGDRRSARIQQNINLNGQIFTGQEHRSGSRRGRKPSKP